MKTRHRLFALAALLAFASGVTAQTPPAARATDAPATAYAADSTDTAAAFAIRQIDAARLDAMTANDLAALDALLAADCLYVHSNGVVQTKREFLRALEIGDMRYVAIRYVAPPEVRIYGNDTAILTGTTRTDVHVRDAGTLHLQLRFTATYVRIDGRWQLASYQSTSAPSSSPTRE